MDLRLALPALVVWVITAICLGVSPTTAAVIAVGAFVIGAATLIAQRKGLLRWEFAGPIVVGAAMAATCAAAMALRLEVRDAHPLRDMRGKATVVVTVREDPVDFGPAGGGRVRIRADIGAIGSRTVRPAPVEVIATETWSALSPGQHVRALVSIRAAPMPGLVVARLTASGQPRLLGRPPPLQRAATHIRDRLQQATSRSLPADAAGLFPGLVLGDDSALAPDLEDDFRAAGLSHLTAVSGANFAIVCGAVIGLIRLLGAPPKVVAVCGVLVILGFVVVVRPTPSVLRAAMMGVIGLLALVTARRSQALPALGAAVIGGVLWWPELARAPGFALSVAATAGLVMLSPSVRDVLRSWWVPPGLAEVLAMAIAAQVVTAPLIALGFGTFSVVSVIANVAVAPVVGVIGIVGTGAAVLAALGPSDGWSVVAAELLIRSLSAEMWWMIFCARHLGSWEWAQISVPDGWVGAVLVGGVTLVVGAGTVWLRRRVVEGQR
ncbi:ComEC/Rec2 family competence protein [Gordonia desulfuricans]|uniref:ComEC/Rec2 family competence protein n=1 Tax=Gordonia desulfuricans TaxID=89051 RepID=UPI00073E748B|nr:ComEC/Rec2 family competence protein [Gordonia desulfuricans]